MRCCARCASSASATSRSSWSTTAPRTARPAQCAPTHPEVELVVAGREPRLRGGGQRGDRPRRKASTSRCSTTTWSSTRAGSRRSSPRWTPIRGRARRRASCGCCASPRPRRCRRPRHLVRRDVAARARRARPRAVRRAGRRREPVRGRGALPPRARWRRSAASTSASSPTSRTPTGACAPSSPAGTAVWVPGAVAYHLGGATIRRMGDLETELIARNTLALVVKSFPAAEARRLVAADPRLPGLHARPGARAAAPGVRCCAAGRERCGSCRRRCAPEARCGGARASRGRSTR